jgi:hypothetical protein
VIRFLTILLFCCSAHAFETRSELVRLLPISSGAANTQQVFSYCQPAQEGSLIDIRYQSEVTNPYSKNVGIGWYLMAWDYRVENGTSTFVRTSIVTPPVMQNVTPAGHHMVVSGSYIHKVSYPQGGNTRCYTLVMWAVSSNPGGSILVEQGYGFLQAFPIN